MNTEKQRIAIAEALGAYEINKAGAMSSLYARWPKKYAWNWSSGDHFYGRVPEFPNELHACHEMEKVLMRPEDNQDDSGLMAQYQESLASVLQIPVALCEVSGDVAYLQKFISATAAQRCEAFLRTIGKWEVTAEIPKE